MKCPTMKEIEIKMTHGESYRVGVAVSAYTGEPVAELRFGDDDEGDGILLTPSEAKRLGAALLKAAACAQAKEAHRG